MTLRKISFVSFIILESGIKPPYWVVMNDKVMCSPGYCVILRKYHSFLLHCCLKVCFLLCHSVSLSSSSSFFFYFKLNKKGPEEPGCVVFVSWLSLLSPWYMKHCLLVPCWFSEARLFDKPFQVLSAGCLTSPHLSHHWLFNWFKGKCPLLMWKKQMRHNCCLSLLFLPFQLLCKPSQETWSFPLPFLHWEYILMM